MLTSVYSLFFSVDELEDMLFVYYYDIYSVDRGIPCYC